MTEAKVVTLRPTFGDAELLHAYAAGDHRAFSDLYDRYDRLCFSFIRRTLGTAHSDAAEDLHQETWISLSRNAHAFDPGRGSFRAWLFTIARRKVVDYFRRRKVVVADCGDEDAALAAPDQRPDPFERLEARELAQRLIEAVEALPLVQRDVFVLFADAGLSLEEISKITGTGVETAKSRLRYARASLRQTLARERSSYV